MECVSPTYLNVPNTENAWRKIANKLYDEWNLPHAIEALDGQDQTIITTNVFTL